MSAVYALYSDPESAQRAVNGLHAAGLSHADIVVMSGEPFEEQPFAQQDKATWLWYIACAGGLIGLIFSTWLTRMTELAWPLQTGNLKKAGFAADDTIPKEGATGWADSYMLSTKAQHPNCAYRWMQYITQPKPQAQQAIYFGETPVNKKACKVMDSLSKGSCAQYSANKPEAYYRSIKFWKTPVADCGNGQKNCMDLRAWTTAWTQVKG